MCRSSSRFRFPIVLRICLSVSSVERAEKGVSKLDGKLRFLKTDLSSGDAHLWLVDAETNLLLVTIACPSPTPSSSYIDTVGLSEV